jgi:hypothetical protein
VCVCVCVWLYFNDTVIIKNISVAFLLCPGVGLALAECNQWRSATNGGVNEPVACLLLFNDTPVAG